jgi:hypothetical protein
MRFVSHGKSQSFGSLLVSFALLLGGTAAQAETWGEWFSENFETHGFVTSKAYFRTPDFKNQVQTSSWRTELNLESSLHVFDADELSIDFFSVLRPTYDAIYEIQGDLYGAHVDGGDFGTAPAFPDDPTAGAGIVGSSVRSFAKVSGEGKGGEETCEAAGLRSNCFGARISGESTIINSDTGTLFSNKAALVPAISIDNVVFFGRVTAPIRPRSSGQANIGGNATGNTYADLAANPLLQNGGLGNGSGTGLEASLALAQANGTPLDTPLNAYQGGIGNAGSLKRGSADINRRETNLAFDCVDNAHPWCFVRELYLEIDYKDTFVRLGKQQIVWGKTDAFRLQDKINPIDLGYHNVFPDLEERRIPQLALDVIHSFGEIGSFQDVSLEFAWVFDQFIPDQFGQCGEAYAFTAACEIRADAGGHQLLNFSLANVKTRDWEIQNTEPGLRLEFRIPEPSIAFSISGFYTFQDLPVAEFRNHYSTENPNPAVMLFIQGLANAAGPVSATVDALAQVGAGAGGPFGYSGGVWLSGFDPYQHNVNQTIIGNDVGAQLGRAPLAGSTLEAANQDLQNAWFALTQVLDPANGGCAGLTGSALAGCGSAISIFGLPWSGAEVTLKYPRIFTLGGSADYQIPGIDTVLRMEMAFDIDASIQDTSKRKNISKSSIFQMAVGLDRSTFIPFLNNKRTAFLSAQTFISHIIDYREKSGGEMVPDETQVISTVFMQNYWRNDSITLTSFAAVDWRSQAVIIGPSLRYTFNDHLLFDVGFNMLWGTTRKQNIRDLCSNQTLSCLDDPTTWQDGNWQTLNAGLQQRAEAPFWGKESFSDRFMRKRDEFWMGVTYQF